MGRLTSSKEKICGNCKYLEQRHHLSGNSYGPWCKKCKCGVSVYEKACGDFLKKQNKY